MERIKFRIEPAMQADLDKMKGSFRSSDNEECFACSGRHVDESAQIGLDISRMCWVGKYDGEPVFIFGVADGEKGIGVPWMLATDELANIKKSFLGVCKTFIGIMLAPYDKLVNYVDIRHRASVEWLEWCGFKLEAPEPYGVEKRLFRKFWMEKKLCANRPQ